MIVTGDHGSGKSTLLRELAAAHPHTARLVPSEPDLENSRSVLGHGDPVDPSWLKLLDRLVLTEHAEKLPHMLSRGTAAKVQLAQAFWLQPETYLLDEPFNGLDQRSRDLVVGLVAEALTAGASVVVATHDVAAFDTLPHRVVNLS